MRESFFGLSSVLRSLGLAQVEVHGPACARQTRAGNRSGNRETRNAFARAAMNGMNRIASMRASRSAREPQTAGGRKMSAGINWGQKRLSIEISAVPSGAAMPALGDGSAAASWQAQTQVVLSSAQSAWHKPETAVSMPSASATATQANDRRSLCRIRNMQIWFQNPGAESRLAVREDLRGGRIHQRERDRGSQREAHQGRGVRRRSANCLIDGVFYVFVVALLRNFTIQRWHE